MIGSHVLCQMADPGAEGASGPSPAPPTGSSGDPSVLSNQGHALMDWRAELPETLRSAGIIQEHPTLEAAAKTLVAQREMLGRGLFLPREEAGTEAHTAGMQKIYEKLGRPATAADYQLPAPEGKTLDKTLDERWRAAFFAQGLNQGQVGEIMAEFWRSADYASNVHAASDAESYAAGRKELFGRFGAATEAVIAKARTAAEHFGAGGFGAGEDGQKFWTQLMQATLPDGSKMANSPHMIATLAAIGESMGEAAWFDSPYFTPGQNTAETLIKRSQELTGKRHAGSITPAEATELTTIFAQLAAERERQAARQGRG